MEMRESPVPQPAALEVRTRPFDFSDFSQSFFAQSRQEHRSGFSLRPKSQNTENPIQMGSGFRCFAGLVDRRIDLGGLAPLRENGSIECIVHPITPTLPV
jgi:hypothetical protein